VISARCEKDELRVGTSDDVGSSDQPFAIEGSGESEGTRLREDGLVKVKESRLRHRATVALDELLASSRPGRFVLDGVRCQSLVKKA